MKDEIDNKTKEINKRYILIIISIKTWNEIINYINEEWKWEC